MKFTIEGGGDFSKIPPAISRAIEIAEGLEYGTLLTTLAMASRLKLSISHIQSETNHPAINGRNRIVIKGKAYFGNRKTIAAARKEFNVGS